MWGIKSGHWLEGTGNVGIAEVGRKMPGRPPPGVRAVGVGVRMRRRRLNVEIRQILYFFGEFWQLRGHTRKEGYANDDNHTVAPGCLRFRARGVVLYLCGDGPNGDSYDFGADYG